MTKDTEALQEAILRKRFPYIDQQNINRPVTVHWFDVLKAINTALEATLATSATDELGFDPTAEVGDEVFPHDSYVHASGLDQPDYKYVHYACGDGPIKSYIVPDDPSFEENGVAVTTIRSPAPTGGTYTLRKIVGGVDCGPVSQPYPGADDLILAPVDPVAEIRAMPFDRNDDYPDVRRDEREKIIAAFSAPTTTIIAPGDTVTLAQVEDGEILPGGDYVVAEVMRNGESFTVVDHPRVLVHLHRVNAVARHD